ncbi:Integrase core domain protein [Tepidimonas charontis]|uniref:Integrase core domain protein n=1 Tax=Tepidimonas charontis TaxID=2267262 RepID=A0A554X5S9_9BURK|nr:Integrase core domain protein [Tepidimonas charontis]
MQISLHKMARTTPAVRAEIAASKEPVAKLARRYNVTEATVRKWRQRDDFLDRSHTPHRLQTRLTAAQEAVVVELRKLLKIPLDDLLALTREYLCPTVSRSGLDRCLRRHGVGSLRAMLPKEERARQPAKTEPGFFHIDIKYLPQMGDDVRRRYLFVAIERLTSMVFHKVMPAKTARVPRFLDYLAKVSPLKIKKILTDNGKVFTDRLFGSREKPTGEHEFDRLCAALGIEHRLTRPRRPQTNGMVELEGPHCRHPAHPPLQGWGDLGKNHRSLRLAVQRPPVASGTRRTHPFPGHERTV